MLYAFELIRFEACMMAVYSLLVDGWDAAWYINLLGCFYDACLSGTAGCLLMPSTAINSNLIALYNISKAVDVMGFWLSKFFMKLVRSMDRVF